VEASRPARERLAFERQIQRHLDPLRPPAEVSPEAAAITHTHVRAYTRVSIRRTYYHSRQCATTRLIQRSNEGSLQLCVSANQRNPPQARLGLAFRAAVPKVPP